MARFKLILETRPVWLLVVAILLALAVGSSAVLWLSGVRPLLDINDAALGLVITALGILITGLGLVLVQLWQRVAKLESDRLADAAAVAALRAEVEVVRDQKRDALDKLTAAASFINRIGLWLAGGRRGSMPQPPDQILPHIDAEFWESDAPGGTDPN